MTSSRSNNFGLIASALASSSRLRSGPPSASARCSARCSRPTKSSQSRACFARPPRLWLAAGSAEQRAHRDVVEHRQAGKRPHDLKGAADAEARRDDRPEVGGSARPRTGSAPSVGSSVPLTRLTSVVLPAPLGPIRPRISLALEREASRRQSPPARESACVSTGGLRESHPFTPGAPDVLHEVAPALLPERCGPSRRNRAA